MSKIRAYILILLLFAASTALSGCLDEWLFKPDYTLTGIDSEKEPDLAKDMQSFFDQRVDTIKPAAKDQVPARQSAYEAQALREALEKKLRAEGYYDARVRVRAGDEPWKDSFNINAGEIYKITSVTLTSEKPYTASAGILKTLKGQTLDAQMVLDAQADFYKAIQKNKCYFSITVEHEAVIDRSAHTASLTFSVKAGPVAAFGPAVFTGNTDVKTSYLEKLVPWKAGDCFERAQIDNLRATLFEGGLFSNVDIKIPDAPAKNSRVPVTITVNERAQHSINAGVTYYSDEGPGVSFGWRHRNLFGSAETFDARLKISSLLQSLEGKFNVPYFLRKDQSFSANATLGREDTDAYLQRGLEGGAAIKRKLSKNWTGSTGTALSLTRIFDHATMMEDNYALLSFPQALTLDTRNDPLDPTRGLMIEGTVEPFVDLFGTAAPFLKLGASAKTYLKVEDNTVLAVRGKWGSIGGTSVNDVPATKRFYAGGGTSVRGFGYQDIGPKNAEGDPSGGRSIIEGSAEIRHKFTDSVGAVMFLDAGTVSENSIPDPSDLSYGTGVGLRYYTAVGPLRFDVGVPLNNREDTDSFQVYLSIGQAF